MIHDNIKFWKTYCLSPLFQKAFTFLESVTEQTPDGTYELDGKKVYAMVQSGNAAQTMPDKLEIHRKYVDVQYLISGAEKILCLHDSGNLDIHTAYMEDRDAAFLKMPADKSGMVEMNMQPGDFVVLFPQDAHFGCIAVSGKKTCPYKKVVVKVAVSE